MKLAATFYELHRAPYIKLLATTSSVEFGNTFGSTAVGIQLGSQGE